MPTITDKSEYKKPRIAFTYPGLPGGWSLPIRWSANAWWMNKKKVRKILMAFGANFTLPEACSYAKITQKQYKYFAWKHPNIYKIRKAFKNDPELKKIRKKLL